ncbi:single-strand DNA-binding protein [Paraburkholderia sp. BL18I3N2]|uniref:single-stranded DNA-binding protein n=1 Tax=unclassified Paraburkholderia TaxID=2615204 RepID=UPI000D0526F6|nr:MULTISPECIES: single-stranded DNA-binding protein [unclassified Paraburkholderia]PRX26124.1 single-strand DNA-binding protein [Paraburkholderia sp. BL18I3N2]PRX95347.1 single-strand DNA-binding protein [Paraburkholderia sp. BL25I1N1]TDY15782.1 single-strand DNA-binding protein [Paraburkholderia sp. BL6665CI2N2]
MNQLFFTGRVAATPVLSNHGDSKVAKFTLISNEYAGRDESSGEAKERQLRIQFTAFGSRGEVIARNVLKGDQLIVEAKLSNNDYLDGQGVERYGYNFTVDNFEFGAPGELRRAQLARRQE